MFSPHRRVAFFPDLPPLPRPFFDSSLPLSLPSHFPARSLCLPASLPRLFCSLPALSPLFFGAICFLRTSGARRLLLHLPPSRARALSSLPDRIRSNEELAADISEISPGILLPHSGSAPYRSRAAVFIPQLLFPRYPRKARFGKAHWRNLAANIFRHNGRLRPDSISLLRRPSIWRARGKLLFRGPPLFLGARAAQKLKIE